MNMEIWTKTKPKIDDEGIWMPLNAFVPEGSATTYKLVMSKEIFIEAYNKWIKENDDEQQK
jgi:hypothetical protein